VLHQASFLVLAKAVFELFRVLVFQLEVEGIAEVDFLSSSLSEPPSSNPSSSLIVSQTVERQRKL
jgi:hypothetical protein